MKKNNFPVVCVIGCVHGNEKIGKRVIDYLKTLKIINGKLVALIANQKAFEKNVRFIDQDLNRSFPGKKDGNHEERLAFKLRKIKADYIIDIHSTTTDVESLIIITRKNKKIINLLKIFNPKRVALMKKEFGEKSLLHQFEVAISFEYGRESEKTYKNTLKDILTILSKLGMIEKEVKTSKNKTKIFKIFGVIKKNSRFVLDKKVKNFELIRKGEVIAKKEDKKIYAKKDFYPVLFGEAAYKEIFGFMAKRIKKL